MGRCSGWCAVLAPTPVPPCGHPIGLAAFRSGLSTPVVAELLPSGVDVQRGPAEIGAEGAHFGRCLGEGQTGAVSLAGFWRGDRKRLRLRLRIRLRLRTRARRAKRWITVIHGDLR